MPELHVRDPDDSVHSRVVDYARRNGRTVSEAVRELLARGLDASSAKPSMLPSWRSSCTRALLRWISVSRRPGPITAG